MRADARLERGEFRYLPENGLAKAVFELTLLDRDGARWLDDKLGKCRVRGFRVSGYYRPEIPS